MVWEEGQGSLQEKGKYVRVIKNGMLWTVVCVTLSSSSV